MTSGGVCVPNFATMSAVSCFDERPTQQGGYLLTALHHFRLHCCLQLLCISSSFHVGLLIDHDLWNDAKVSMDALTRQSFGRSTNLPIESQTQNQRKKILKDENRRIYLNWNLCSSPQPLPCYIGCRWNGAKSVDGSFDN